jgi:DNA-formamidopyrimidine glycosylase
MPEGPEVTNLTNYLNNYLKGKSIRKITIKSGRYLKHKPPRNFKKFKKYLPLEIEKVECKGKFIYFLFKDSSFTLWNTLGMTGTWTINEDKFNHIELLLDDNSLIYFNDVRNFGTIIFYGKNELSKKINKLGPDILDKKDRSKDFIIRIRKKRGDTLIAVALLDQKVAAGCGNYLRAETLYLSKISPYKIINELSDKELEKIWDNLRQIAWYFYNSKKGLKLNILKKRIFNKYESIENTFLVYKQDQDSKGNLVEHDDINNRTIHYVPKIQK